MIHVFSTNDIDKKPMSKMVRQKSTPLPPAQSPVGVTMKLGKSSALPTNAAQLLTKDFYEQSLVSMPPHLNPSSLFDFKQPDLQRDRDFFKQMLFTEEDPVDFNDAPIDFFPKEFKDIHGKRIGLLRDLKGPEDSGDDEIDEKDMFEETKLFGTHRISLKN